MYQEGDLIIYANAGVCRVEEISTEDYGAGAQQYYHLKPLYQSGIIHTPVLQNKMFMRPVISREEAKCLVRTIPSIEASGYFTQSTHQLTSHYQAYLDTHDCTELATMIISIHEKKRYLKEHRQKFGQIDDRFMKFAESMLNGELAAALEIPVEQVPCYIAERVEKREDGDYELNA